MTGRVRGTNDMKTEHHSKDRTSLTPADGDEVARLMKAAAAGDRTATGQLLPLVYDELRRLADRKMSRENPGQTLTPTALVHEAYLRLVKSDDLPRWDTRAHFYSAAAEAMRRILIESARRKGRIRHGGELNRIRIESDLIPDDQTEFGDELLELDRALEELRQEHPEVARIVLLRYFGGLTMGDAAAALEISTRTAQRHWAFAKAWLYRKLHSDQGRGE